jgi:RNA polymerase sigma factor (sigma-70 family)
MGNLRLSGLLAAACTERGGGSVCLRPALAPVYFVVVEHPHTTLAIQGYLDELAGLRGDAPAEPVVRALLARAVGRLELFCGTLLFRSYPRLTRPPLNLQSEEMLGAVVERLLKAMREVRPGNVRQFFAIANQHMRWELNDLARRLDEQTPPLPIPEGFAAVQESSGSQISPVARRLFQAIEGLPDEEREVFSLIRIQGMTRSEAAEILDVSVKTVQRRVNRAVLLLTETVGDLRPETLPPAGG